MIRFRAVRSLALAALFVAAAAVTASAATVNVSPGDGTLQAALTAAQDGDVLVLKPGIYTGGGARTGISNLTIRGKGKVVIDGTGYSATEGTLHFTNVNGLRIEKVTIKNAADDGIYLTDCTNFSIKKCTIQDCDDSGIEDTSANGYVVDRCKIVNCSWGLALGYGGTASNVTVTHSQFLNCSSYSIDLHAGGALISTNVIRGGAARAIEMRSDVNGSRIEKNVIADVGGYGIQVQGQGHTIANNRITNAGSYGIQVVGAGGNTVDRNVVKRSHDDGLYIDSTGNTISNNKASKNGAAGDFDLLSTGPASDNTYTANKFGTTQYAP
jgi:parallel beta-helix repeat protein